MKAAPNKSAVKVIADRPPRVVDAGKNGPKTKSPSNTVRKSMAPKQPTSTGTAKRPQYL